MASTAPTQAQALDALRRVLHINPSHEQAGRAYKKLVVQRGIDLAQAGDADARVVLLEASAVDPENESVWLWLARSVTAEESIEYYERVLELNPSNTHRACRVAGTAAAARDHRRAHAPALSGRTGSGSRSAGHVRRRRHARRRHGRRAVPPGRRGTRAADDGDAGVDAGRVPGLSERREHRGLGAAWRGNRGGRGRIRHVVRGASNEDEAARWTSAPSTSRRWKSRRWKCRRASRTRWSCRSRPSPSGSMQLSDVDSYVAGAESTYASSARVDVGTTAVHAARDRGRGSRDRRRRNGAACDGR